MSDIQSADARVYPVTINLVCPEHGQPKRITVTDAEAEHAWTEYFQRVHAEALGCQLPLTVVVPVKAQGESLTPVAADVPWALYEAMRSRVGLALQLVESFDPTSGATRARVFAADLRRILEGTGGD